MATLSQTTLQAAGHYRQTWEAIVGSDVTVSDLEDPKFWQHVAARLTRMSIINVLCEDETWFAEVIVLNSGIGFAKVKVLRHVAFYEAGEQKAQDERVDFTTEVKYRGPAVRFSVVRLADGVVLRENFQTRPEAENWQRQHEAMIRRAA